MRPEVSVAEWLTHDPDPVTRAELQALLSAGRDDEIAERFAGRLAFGTAGLRAPMGAGPMRMNRLVVRQTAWGLGRYLLGRAAPERGVVVGYDARRNSAEFARDSARVFAALGLPARVLPQALPTPVLAFAVTEVGAAAGVMVTASHNPPGDNGYKVYLDDGSQILSPIDLEIAAWIARAPLDVELAPVENGAIEVLDADVVEHYVAAITGAIPRRRPAARSSSPGQTSGGSSRPGTSCDRSASPGSSCVGSTAANGQRRRPVLAYTPLHGVGGAVVLKAFAAAGLDPPTVVESQFDPDGSFPTVEFPNPEEPGAIDRVVELARRIGADAALANDPDADRLGVAIPTSSGDWRLLSGDEIGALLADYILAGTHGEDRMVITTLVSSSLLGKMAAASGVAYEETFTGFKHMAQVIRDHPERRCVFAYEQALGFLVAPVPLDKDGISAAVLFADLALDAVAEGRSVEDLLADIADRFGRYDTAERSLRMPLAAGAQLVESLRRSPPEAVGDHDVTDVTWYEGAGLLRLQCGSAARIQVRPSGTEPKVKIYAEVVDGRAGEFADAFVAIASAPHTG